MLFPTLASLAALAPLMANAQVTATGTNGPTNPPEPTFYPIGSTVNQTSDSRLVSLNNVNDFCMCGPPVKGADSEIGNLEAVVVAYCTQPRNGARLIPDGTITSAHFVKTPLYVQISGTWDGTAVDIVKGDSGGELDPHGATGEGNPVGGNVTSNVEGKDVFYEEWMMFISDEQFCLRICTAEDPENGITAARQCEHEIDTLGCNWVMAIPNNISATTFDECEGEPALPPGAYPQPDGSTSTFKQRYTGQWTEGTTSTGTFTVGVTVTPSAPYKYPATSKCTTYASVSNGVNTNDWKVNTIYSTPLPFTGNPEPTSTAASASSAAASGASGAASGASTITSAAAGAGSTEKSKAATAKEEATGGNKAAAAETSGAALSSFSRSWETSGNGLAVAGLTFTGLLAGMVFVL